jgi:hypothetical protein
MRLVDMMKRDSRVEESGTFRQSMDDEATRVALYMAAFRDECTHRLRGDPVPFRTTIDRGTKGGVRFSPFYYYPFLFASGFPSIPAEKLHDLALANRILLEAILLSDKRIDEAQRWTPEDLFLVDSYYQKALEILFPLFPLEHPFWQETQRWFFQYAHAIYKEQTRHRCQISSYTHQEFYEISTGKVALIKTNLLAMSWLSNDSGALAPLMESQDRFLVGFQCFDDLRDWKEDLQQRNFTFLLTRVFSEGALQQRGTADECPSRGEVGQVLYHKGIAEDHLRLAERYFQEALDFAKEADVPAWIGVVKGFLQHCNTLRLDLGEIRRRAVGKMNSEQRRPRAPEETTEKAEAERVAAYLERALLFLVRSQQSDGSFHLERSAYPYMSPSIPLPPSRMATSLVFMAVEPLQNLHPRLPPLCLRASQWLARPQTVPPNPDLPQVLEECFVSTNTRANELFEFDSALDDGLPLSPHGLFWANMIFRASTTNIRLPKLESLVEDCIHREHYVPWTHTYSPAPSDLARTRGACSPTLPLLLFCQALGSQLPQTPLHQYLLRRYRSEGTWNHPTETALTLLCLLTTGYQGPELYAAAETLIRTQEADGSWPPNAFYEQDDSFYGSRELSTAWCLLALFIYHLPGPFPTDHQRSPYTLRGEDTCPEIVVHEDQPDDIHSHTVSTLKQLRSVLPPPWPQTICIGHWPTMPPHFLLNKDESMTIGVNLLEHHRNPSLSITQRPLRVEILMAMMKAHRYRIRGALKDRLEQIYVAGLALCTSGRIWPNQYPWQQLGMERLDWSWCLEHEAFLWDELKRFLLHPTPKTPHFQWLLPDQQPTPDCPIPRGASLFLGKRLFEESYNDGNARQTVSDLLCRGRPDIVRVFRRKTGLESNENRFA